ncbi:MAG TPA: hypothetical protein VEB43_03705 [Anaeromyxobacter sp.]|nr:hypothetical protein [Anaeromyxobacter sp.]
MAVSTEAAEKHGFPGLAWGPIIAGVLLALASHVVLGLVGGALGFAAEPADSRGLAVAAGFWALLTPFVATLLGAWLANRLAARRDEAGTNLHGVMVWAIGLLAGALFLAGTAMSGAVAAGSAAAGNASAAQGLLGGEPGDATTGGEEAARRASVTSGAGAMAALCGLAGAFAGAGIARARRREGKGRSFPWRIAIQRTDRQDDRRLAEGRYGRAERSYPRPEDEVRDVSRDEGPGAPADPYHH